MISFWKWKKEVRIVVLTKNGNQEQLTIPEDLEPYFLEIEGETDADGSPYTVCYLPVRFTAEALGANVT